MQPVINFESTDCKVPCLPKGNIAVHGQQYFVECVGTWYSNNTVSICNRKLSNSSNSCNGVRSRTRRQFVNGAPLLLPFNLDQVVRNGMIHTMSDFQDKLKMAEASYELVAVTYGNGQHFISSLKIGQVVSKNCEWYWYDGLIEYHKRGTGIQPLLMKNKTPTGYQMSYTIYLRGRGTG